MNVKNSLCIALLVAGVLTPAFDVTAAPTPILSYQARITGNSGSTIADGTYAMRFKIYSVATDGTALWEESHTANVSDGVVSVRLGTSETIGLDFNSGDYYLGVTIGNDSELSPRIQLGAVPFAANTAKLDGKSVGTGANNVLGLDSSGGFSVGGTIQTSGNLDAGTSTLDRLTVSTDSAFQAGLVVANDLQAGTTTLDRLTVTDGLTVQSGSVNLPTGSVAAGALNVAALNNQGKIRALTGDYVESLDGSALTGVTATAAAGTLTGTTLAANVTASSLTTLGTLAGLTLNGDVTFQAAAPFIALSNGSTLTFEDTASNELLRLVDAGAVGNATLTGDFTVNSGARIGSAGTGADSFTAYQDSSLLVQGAAEFDGSARFDGGLTFGSGVGASEIGITAADLTIADAGDNTLVQIVDLGTTGNLIVTGGGKYGNTGTGADSFTWQNGEGVLFQNKIEVDGVAWFDGGLVLTAGGGQPSGGTLNSYYETTSSVDFADTANAACSESGDITLTGASASDRVLVSAPDAVTAGTFLTGHVTAGDTVRIQFCNLTGGAVNPGSKSYTITLIR